jgi:hypothetical protein
VTEPGIDTEGEGQHAHPEADLVGLYDSSGERADQQADQRTGNHQPQHGAIDRAMERIDGDHVLHHQYRQHDGCGLQRRHHQRQQWHGRQAGAGEATLGQPEQHHCRQGDGIEPRVGQQHSAGPGELATARREPAGRLIRSLR